jgi:hypothetical protein
MFLVSLCCLLLGGKNRDGIPDDLLVPLVGATLQLVHANTEVVINTSLLLGSGAVLGVFAAFNRGQLIVGLTGVVVRNRFIKWQQVTSLGFTINTPKKFGVRSARQGMSNWIDLVVEGKRYRHEFYIRTTMMEDSLLELSKQIRIADGRIPVVEIIYTKPGWLQTFIENNFGEG